MQPQASLSSHHPNHQAYSNKRHNFTTFRSFFSNPRVIHNRTTDSTYGKNFVPTHFLQEKLDGKWPLEPFALRNEGFKL